MSEWETISDKDLMVLLKHSIDFNTAIIAICSQVIGQQVKSKHVTRELRKVHDEYSKRIEALIKPYDNNSNSN